MMPLSGEPDRRVRSELRPGERILWTGGPKPTRCILLTVPAALGGITFLGFGAFWMRDTGLSRMLFVRAVAEPGALNPMLDPFSLFVLPALILGLALLSVPFWAYRRALRTRYVLTDQRAMILGAGWFTKGTVLSFTSAELAKMERRESDDGTGDLVFEKAANALRGSFDPISLLLHRGFMGIENVRKVEELIRRTHSARS